MEPDPANQPGGTLTTNYTYDWMNHVTQVSMPRGSTTQTRTFVYNSAGQLTSATNPENGTVTYTYSTTGQLHDKHDAKGQDAVFTYDSLNRVTMVQQYPSGVGGGEDACARVTYSYDTNPINPSFSQNSYGRLTAKQYGGCLTGNEPTFYEMYSYHPAGAVTAKQVLMTQLEWISPPGMGELVPGDLEVDYTYDQTGRVASMAYPWWFTVMGRPRRMLPSTTHTTRWAGPLR